MKFWKILFFYFKIWWNQGKNLTPLGKGGGINCQEKITRESETTESKQKIHSCGPEKKGQETALKDGQADSYTIKDVVSFVAEMMLPLIKTLKPFYLEDRTNWR